MTDTLELRYVPLSTVRRWDRNPKKHDMGALAASIERYGFKDPPAYDPALNTGTGGIVEGNGRAEVLTWMQAQGRDAPRGIREDGDEWLIPVLFGVDQPSQAAAEAYGVDHNNLTMVGGDFTALDMSRMWGDGFADVLAGLSELGELPITFDSDDLVGLLAMLPEAGAGGDEFDATPEDGPTRTKLGELWSIGGVHRLLVGDCTDAANVARLMGGERADMGFSDPPYNVEYVGKTQDALTIQNDDTADVAVAGVRSMMDVLDVGAPLYVCFPAEQPAALAQMWSEPLYLQSMIVWAKNTMVMGRKDYHYQHEPIWYGWKLGAAHRWHGGYDKVTLWQVDRPQQSEDHPTEKPVAIPSQAIENSSKANAIVVDFFAGTAPVLVAAHRTNRRAYLCEIAPRYADVILRRAEAEGLACERVETP